MTLLTTLPPLASLANPHLAVIGPGSDQALRVLAHRLARDHALVVLARSDARDTPGPRTVDAQRLDLIGALAGGADSLAHLRALLLPLAGEAREAVASVLDALLADAAVAPAPPTPDPCPILPVRFPAGMRSPVIAALLDDVVQHAMACGRPEPVARVALSRLASVRRSLREVRTAIERSELDPASVVLLLPAADAADWCPYAAQGLVPELPPAVVAAEIELETHALGCDAEFAAAPADALVALATHRVAERRWAIAWERAVAGERHATAVSSAHVLAALAERAPTAAVAAEVRALLAGDRACPAWWERGPWLVGSLVGAHALRTAVVLETLLEAAAAPVLTGVAKALLIDAAVVADPAAAAALTRLLRSARKHHLTVAIVADAVDPACPWAGLVANWLADPVTAERAPHLQAVARAPGAAGAWWFTSHERRAQPVGTWFTSEEVAAGDRLLSGASDVPEVA